MIKGPQKELTAQEKSIVYILAAVQFCHMLDFVVLMPLGPTLMEYFSIGPTKFATLVSSYNFSGAVAGVLLGTIADRFDRKKLLMLSITGFSVGTFLCGISHSFSQLLFFRIITGLFGGVSNSLVFAMTADIVPYARRGKAMGVIMSAFSAASVLGIPSALAISDKFGWQLSFIYIAILGFIVLAISFYKIPSLEHLISEARGLAVLKNFARIITNKDYVIGHGFIFLVAMSMFVLIPFLSPIAVNNFGIATYELKYMYLVGGIVTIVTARIFGRWTDDKGASYVFTLLILTSIIPILVFTHAGPMNLFWYLVLSSAFMSLVSGRMIPTMTIITHIPNDQDRGSFMGVVNAVRSLGSASATLIAGLIIHETAQGKLVGQDYAGYLSIFLIFISVLIARRIKKRYLKDEISVA
jgi:DHA1 family inner membrane transport protein